MIKLNVDGSSISNSGRSGYGSLLRNSSRDWIFDFSERCGFTSNINVDSIAGNRTRVSWVKARYPNRWTTMEFLLDYVSNTIQLIKSSFNIC
ncbi:hypothetical protein MTR_5g089930 [Medicago truncatula]|uniref:Uncharacterized protein n=1 Tax=Medicago truncatula TaxID=3880 RepID=G7KCW7_MEDTR|nr:hypothetical protein MTR_5g089930 [Medicago truncatula]